MRRLLCEWGNISCAQKLENHALLPTLPQNLLLESKAIQLDPLGLGWLVSVDTRSCIQPHFYDDVI